MSDLGRVATARRLYLHVMSGGSLTPDDVSRLVQAIEDLVAVNERIKAVAATYLNDSLDDYHRANIAEAKLATARNDALEEAANVCGEDNGPWRASAWHCRQAIRALKSTK